MLNMELSSVRGILIPKKVPRKVKTVKKQNTHNFNTLPHVCLNFHTNGVKYY